MMQPVAPYAVPRDGHTLHDLPGDPSFRIYLPEVNGRGRKGGRLPVIVHLHGGGFCLISHPSWVITRRGRLCRAPARARAPPACAHRHGRRRLSEDGALADKADKLLREAADVSRVFLVGDSSGANISHFAAARVGQDGAGIWAPLCVAGCVLIQPGFMRATRSRSELEVGDSVFFTLDMLDKCNAMALPVGATKEHPFTCPMGPQGPPLESVPLPPMLVAVAENDLVRDTNLEYRDALRAAGKEAEVLLNRGMGHAFYLNKFAVDMGPSTGERTQKLIDAIVSFIAFH
ncbi:unnamed protein product [Miscanthus lutarioriparius]|uniref:Alpha/beta hydrolase fold-3 domain-containing protein n=1 Tax=Miscanthus lutarioriparius TaxID=422564 RepID=A0A811RQY1_9POAL|nr:unnamed protein product [Miscanthus lutarioriparius]